MTLPSIVFATGFLLVGFYWLRKQLPFYRAAKDLELQFEKEGLTYSFWADVGTRLRFNQGYDSFEKAEDTKEVQQLKKHLVKAHMEIANSFKFVVVGAIAVFVLTVIVGAFGAISSQYGR